MGVSAASPQNYLCYPPDPQLSHASPSHRFLDFLCHQCPDNHLVVDTDHQNQGFTILAFVQDFSDNPVVMPVMVVSDRWLSERKSRPNPGVAFTNPLAGPDAERVTDTELERTPRCLPAR